VNPSKKGVFLKKANGERVKANTVPSIVFKTTAGVETMANASRAEISTAPSAKQL